MSRYLLLISFLDGSVLSALVAKRSERSTQGTSVTALSVQSPSITVYHPFLNIGVVENLASKGYDGE
jgi:hypothetical protein